MRGAAMMRGLVLGLFLAVAAHGTGVPVTAILRDGSRVVGFTSVTELPLRVGSQAVTNFALSRVRSVQTVGATQTVVPGYGEPMRGRVELTSLPVETALGAVLLPWNLIEELQVRSATAGALTWLAAPGAPGLSLTSTGEILLQGGATWTRQSFPLPLAVEFEMFLESRQSAGGWLDVELVADAPTRNLLDLDLVSSTPTRITTACPSGLRFLYGQLTPKGYKDGVSLRQTHTAFHSIRQQPEAPFYVTAGVWQPVRFEVVGDWTRLEWNGRPYELRGVQIPQKTARLRITADPNSRWRIRNLVVR